MLKKPERSASNQIRRNIQMNQRIVCAAFLAALGLAAMTGCTSYEPPPKAVTRSSFTGIPAEEQKKMPVSSQKVLTLEEAQSLAVQNNPNFKTKYFAVVAARAAYYGAFAPYMPKITVGYQLGQSFSEPNNVYDTKRNGSRTFENTPSASASWLIFDSFVREMNLMAAKHGWKQTEALELDAVSHMPTMTSCFPWRKSGSPAKTCGSRIHS